MAAEAKVGIGADLSQLRRDLAKLPNMSTEAAQKTLIGVEKAVQKAEKAAKASAAKIAKANKQAAKAAEQAAGKADEALKDMGDTAGDAESSIRAVSGAIGMISPEAEEAMNVVAELAGGLEGVTKGTGLLGGNIGALATAAGVASVAVAALATVALVVANHTAEARTQMAEYRAVISATDADTRSLIQSQNALRLASGDVAGFVGDLQIQTALLAGEVSSADVRAGELGGTLADTLKPQLLAAGKAVAENEQRIADLRAAMDSGSLAVGDLTQAHIELDQALAARGGLEVNLEAIKELGHTGREAINSYTAAMEEKAQAEDGSGKASKAHAAAVLEVVDAEALLLEAQAERLAAEQRAAAIVSGATAHRLDAIDTIDAAEQAALSKLLDTEVATQEQIEAVRAEFHQRRLDYIDAETQAVVDSVGARTEASKVEALAIEQAHTEAASSIAGATADVFSTIATEMAESNKEAARTAFYVSKAAALSQVVIDTSLAVSQVNSTWAATPPVAAALSGAAIAVGVAQGAAIAAEQPSFHVGGLIAGQGNQAPDEVSIRAQAGEAVLNRRAAERLGEMGINDLNRGRGSGGGLLVVQQYKHRTFDAFMQDHLKLPSSSLRRAVSGSGRVGHRRH